MDIKHATQPEGSYAQGNALAELHVNMSNILVRAAHGLTLSEKRLMACCVAQLDSMRIGRRPGFDQLRVKLTALDFAETYEIDPKVAYRDMIAASDNLFKRYIRYVEDTPKGKQETKRLSKKPCINKIVKQQPFYMVSGYCKFVGEASDLMRDKLGFRSKLVCVHNLYLGGAI
jgi:hypothetical protein